MHIEDPNTPATPDTTPTDVQPADTGAPPVADGGDTPQPAAAELDAFSAGVEAAREQEAREDLLPGDAPAAADGQQPQDGTPATPAAAEPNAPPANEQPPAQPAHPQQPTVEDEVKQLGLKERAAERFQELHTQARDARERVSQWEETVQSTGATPEQFGGALRYLSDINSGDPKRMADAYERMQGELQWLGQQLGREAPGFDPLSAHPDLAGRVTSGDITRDVALELAQHRQTGQLQQNHTQAQQDRQQQDLQYQQGIASVQALGTHLRAGDALFDQKLALLAPTIDIIQRTLPPAQWQTEIHRAYLALPATAVAAPAAAAPVARSAPNPIRANSAAPVAPQITPENAFDIGVQAARARGL
ncbi:TPA: hypothetical protein ACOEPF_000416 [Stenotrophomonas maltophilia]|jgi:hypothetical protein|uniref:hypothetical protein n=1 Tax=Stenotrophomonas TaxID=40323 RepID=UPI00201CBFDB|nr:MULTISPECIES: hypothetical protein [Stenotrophomonas]MBN5024503.1 hypothetical protein [Stenotrophomonas maltophilia]MDH1274545.1 hypothetical protein [Stenotrophomonas sp. GD03937]MDH1484960.1 hypothetical protein [Stenotrophomonas sp. GD03712]UQY95826.1 hypothetical protein LZ605_00205 [Stenotrophomonas maltophilia]UQY98110.1 hypothetical protein LZ605_22705 [Stenotrophomonas maltophilia]